MSGTVIPLGPYADLYFDDNDREPRRVTLRLPEVEIDLSGLPMTWFNDDDAALAAIKETDATR